MTLLGPSGGEGRRRSRWGGITLIVLAVVVLFAAGFGVAWILRGNTPTGTTATQAPTSSPQPCVTVTVIPGTALPKPGKVTTNVYNSTDRNGLAARTAEELKSRGFVIATVANDPLSKTITGVGEIRYGPKGAESAQLMRFYIPGAKLVKDGRKDATIDTVLGEQFERVAPSAQVEKALSTPVPSPSGPGCSASPRPSTPRPSASTPAPTPAA